MEKCFLALAEQFTQFSLSLGQLLLRLNLGGTKGFELGFDLVGRSIFIFEHFLEFAGLYRDL